MKTIETKISKSGATIYYVDGKRTSRENAMFIQRMNDAEARRLAKIEAEKAERENELATVNNEVADGGKTFTTVKADPLNALDTADYAITVDAFNFAVDNEIEEAEIAAAESRAIARILANDNLAARYEKAKSQVKCERYENGYCGWYFKGKHSDKWEHDETKAAACLTRYGLSRFEFSVLSEDETAVINSNGYDESAFDLLPTVNELNDCRSDIEKEFDEFAAEDTDRDARFNHGERHAAKLEKQLRKLDPTVEVTYDINEDDKDVFYLRFGKYVYRTPFATLDAVEDTFHLWSEDDQVNGETDEDAHNTTKKIEVAIGADAVPAMIDLFEPNKITLNTPAQILKLIEDTAGNSFSFDYESYFINTDDETRHKFITRHFVSECKNYSFIEIFTDDGKLDHVEFLKHFLAGYKEVKFYLAAPAQGNESQDDDTDKYFELADELDEIGGDICNTKDILERKIANGAPQTEIKSLEGYIDEREGEYRALHKRIYGVEPQADNKVYPIDIAIYHGGSALTEAELEDTAAQFRTAITANGNFGKVEVKESYLSVIGDIGGDNKTIWKLIGDLCWRGDCVLESWDAETEELREMPGIEIDALLERMGIDNEPLAFEIPAYDAAVKKIFGSDAGAIFTPGGHLTVEVAV